MKFNPDNGAEIWANSGCKLGPVGLPGDDDTWSASAYTVGDMVTDTNYSTNDAPDTDGGSSSTS